MQPKKMHMTQTQGPFTTMTLDVCVSYI